MGRDSIEQFDVLVQRLEIFSRQHPAAYKVRVGLLAALGYAYASSVLILLCSAIWFLTGGINWITILLWLSIGRLFWLNYDVLKGIELSREQVPHLFLLIDELTSALKAPPCHRVLLTDKLNAGVLQVPRFGVLGWYRNYLFLGLPLMQAVSPAQFRSTLAHELTHLSGNHSRFSGWIYRLRQIWYLMVVRFKNAGQSGSWLFTLFFNWYEPFFRAYSFVLARANEYEADRCAAVLAGQQNAAEKLINLHIKDYFLQRSFLPQLYKQAAQQPEPPDTTLTQLSQALQTGIDAVAARLWFDLALAETTDNEDTHPCLAERLSAFGYTTQPATLPIPMDETAAQHFLGNQVASLTAQLDAIWKQEMAARWQQLYRTAQQQKHQLARLEAKAKTQPLTVEEAWKQAELTAGVGEQANAIPLFQALLKRAHDHPQANYRVGEWLLQQKDRAGIEYLERAIAQRPSCTPSACELIYGFLQQQGEFKAAQSYLQRSQQQARRLKLAREERQLVTVRDKFESADLLPAETAQIASQLEGFSTIKAAYLVRKQVTHWPEEPLYVLGVLRQYGRLRTTDSGTVQAAFTTDASIPSPPSFSGFYYQSDGELVAQIETELNFSGETQILILNQHQQALWRALRQVPGSQVK